MLAPYSCSQGGYGGNDLPTNDRERLNPVDLRNHAQNRLNPQRGEPAQLPDQLAHLGAILAHVKGKCASPPTARSALSVEGTAVPSHVPPLRNRQRQCPATHGH